MTEADGPSISHLNHATVIQEANQMKPVSNLLLLDLNATNEFWCNSSSLQRILLLLLDYNFLGSRNDVSSYKESFSFTMNVELLLLALNDGFSSNYNSNRNLQYCFFEMIVSIFLQRTTGSNLDFL